jgi:hypothetical protein
MQPRVRKSMVGEYVLDDGGGSSAEGTPQSKHKKQDKGTNLSSKPAAVITRYPVEVVVNK